MYSNGDNNTMREKKLSIVEIVPPKTIAEGGIHDLDNEAIAVLQNPTEALAGFPMDRRMGIDWVKALNNGLINPRADFSGEGEMNILDMDIIMKNTLSMPYVRFPHKSHTEWLDCNNCHDDIFIKQANGNAITMSRIFLGKDCGICHDRVAFSLFICERCHNTPHENSPKQWW
jgi:c(7)-type cytochrome triheme protein